VVAGWTVTRYRPVLRWLHIASVIYSIGIETLPLPCPLTLAERWLELRAGIKPYEEPFLVHYLEAIVYPDIPEPLLTAGAVAVCAIILGIYALRYRRRRFAGW